MTYFTSDKINFLSRGNKVFICIHNKGDNDGNKIIK